MKNPLQYAESQYNGFINDLKEILRIPSISTDSAYKTEVNRCAQWLVRHLKQIGIENTELVQTDGHPIVYAEYFNKASNPTVLIYGHYDVQPPDPIELWNTDPFEPKIMDNKIFGRGTNDDKGQLFIVIKAIQSILNTEGYLPCNLKIIIEGEEEIGSENVIKFIERHSQTLTADIALACDTGMLDEKTPAITIALRGIVYAELLVKSTERDLHSGEFGGAVINPLNFLSKIIAELHDVDNKITIPGFYDQILELSEQEYSMLQAIPFDENYWLESAGVQGFKTEKGYSLAEAINTRPSFDVHGIWGGYSGEGIKSIIPSCAGVKFSFRLVSKQQPERIVKNLKTYLKSKIPAMVQHKLRILSICSPVLMDIDHPAMKAAVDALNTTFEIETFFIREGGSIGVVAEIKRVLKLDTILMGFGLVSDAIHSPNENFGLDRFKQGIETVIRFFNNYSKYQHSFSTKD
jgi:acetylornithine deacetylase/succinyl-diaminopimelate desuccinylase-like protein